MGRIRSFFVKRQIKRINGWVVCLECGKPHWFVCTRCRYKWHGQRGCHPASCPHCSAHATAADLDLKLIPIRQKMSRKKRV